MTLASPLEASSTSFNLNHNTLPASRLSLNPLHSNQTIIQLQQVFNPSCLSVINQTNLRMSFTNTQSFATQAPSLFGRGGYNGPANDSEDDESHLGAPMNYGRGGYNRGPDDDDEEDGRGGYN
jgi:hypothetical protein